MCCGSWNCCWTLFVPQASICSWNCRWAQGQAQGVYLLGVETVLLGTFRSSGPKAGPKGSICYRSWHCCWALFVRLGPRPGPRSLSVTGLETAVGHFSFHWAKGQAQGAYLLRVLKLHIRYSVIFRYAALCLLWLFHVLSQLNPCPPLKGVGGTRVSLFIKTNHVSYHPNLYCSPCKKAKPDRHATTRALLENFSAKWRSSSSGISMF